jgi:hypothetical protein
MEAYVASLSAKPVRRTTVGLQIPGLIAGKMIIPIVLLGIVGWAVVSRTSDNMAYVCAV